ncbi:putative ATP synthase F1 subunit epsilon [Magnetofaba australis IT-1]|uniref:ATP synthase epsilon chain n=1 Tax=Magnetofaba australis IT-1 TaxID=1434232 RepID=A0A1Y2JZU8_9PROT|nr:putative ATP synthase F1 subunit epsilon [Magnetofaba australis IT-1]
MELELITPEKVIYSEDVQIVTVPGSEGYFGVIPGHVPMITTLKSGVVRVGQDDDSVYIAVSKGFAEVRPDRVTLLIDKATLGTEVDLDEAEIALSEAEKRMNDSACEGYEHADACDRAAFHQAQIAAAAKRYS